MDMGFSLFHILVFISVDLLIYFTIIVRSYWKIVNRFARSHCWGRLTYVMKLSENWRPTKNCINYRLKVSWEYLATIENELGIFGND